MKPNMCYLVIVSLANVSILPTLTCSYAPSSVETLSSNVFDSHVHAIWCTILLFSLTLVPQICSLVLGMFIVHFGS